MVAVTTSATATPFRFAHNPIRFVLLRNGYWWTPEGGMENTMTDKNESVTASGAQCRLLLLPKHLPVGLAIGIKAVMFTRVPKRLSVPAC